MKQLLDLVQHRFALLPAGPEALLLVERVDVGIAAVGIRSLGRHDLRDPRGGVAVEAGPTDAHALQFFRRPRGEERRALHRPRAQPDAHGAEIAHDGFAPRKIRRGLMQPPRIASLRGTGPGQYPLPSYPIAGRTLDGQREI